MITLTYMNDLQATKDALEKLKQDYPKLFNKLLENVNLTRALQFKYQYLGCLIMDEDPGDSTPAAYGSVLRLYKQEVQELKKDRNFQVLKQILSDFKNTGYAKISLLVLGMTPESLVGTSNIR